jgi:hypothetical protein
MDIDKIFNVFDYVPTDNIFKEHSNLEKEISLNVELIQKLFNKKQQIKNEISLLFTDKNQGLDFSDNENIVNVWYYNKLWDCIKKIEVTNLLYQNKLIVASTVSFLNNLTEVLLYFQNREEYEKCAHIKEILKIVELFSK